MCHEILVAVQPHGAGVMRNRVVVVEVLVVCAEEVDYASYGRMDRCAQY